MAISDKTRKVLWGRSGNRCAMCRHELVVDATDSDDESVVGDECHIISAKANGPRRDPAFPSDQFDGIENLILLCRIHHKTVDDQCETYTVRLVQTLKANHEAWVKTALTEDKSGPVRVRRLKKNIPSHLVRLTSGRDLLNFLSNAHGFQFEHDDPESEAQADSLSAFLQETQDWGDVSADLEAGDRVRAAYRLSSLLSELEEGGFWVFGSREIRRLEGGVGSSSDFPISILRVIKPTHPDIVKVNIEAKDNAVKRVTDKTSDTFEFSQT